VTTQHRSRGSLRSRASWVSAAAALVVALVVWVVLLAPDDALHRSPTWLLRLPGEVVLLLGVIVLLPSPWRRRAGLVVGALLGALSVVKLLDIGFTAALGRPFDLATDWTYLASGRDLAADSLGRTGADAAVGAVVVLVLVLLVGTPLALRRLAAGLDARLQRHRTVWARGLALAAVAWLVAAATTVPGGSGLAAAPVVGLVTDHVAQARAQAHDRAVFAGAVADDPFADTPPADLLTGLRGKDVLLVFVESYGEVAVSGPESAGVRATLAEAGSQLTTAGYSLRSGWLDSPTFGGTSWLAHSTLQSGVWVDSQRRYDQLVETDRLTLSGAFGRAGWRTVVDVPSNRSDWPQARSFYHYDQVYDARNVGYAGPKFGYATMPDQFTLKAFADRELTDRPRAPVMAEIDLVTSHVPWAPLPRLVEWDTIGDGSAYWAIRAQAATKAQVWRDPASVRAAYAESISYSLDSLVDLVRQVHDDNLVLVLLGDHQPSTVVAGPEASHRVPVTLVAHDSRVTDRMGDWGWAPGMSPAPGTPTWPMDDFRDRFLAAFGPLPAQDVHGR
jgi:hypothetical protein